MGALTGLLCCSIIVVIAIVPWLGNESFYRNEAIYAMCVSIATMVLVLAVIARQKMTDGKSARGCEGIFAFIVLCIFAVIWVALAAVCTFRGPFLNTGNGKCRGRPLFPVVVPVPVSRYHAIILVGTRICCDPSILSQVISLVGSVLQWRALRPLLRGDRRKQLRPQRKNYGQTGQKTKKILRCRLVERVKAL